MIILRIVVKPVKSHPAEAAFVPVVRQGPGTVVDRESYFVTRHPKAGDASVSTILIVILILLLLGALPTWPYSSGWGYYPSGGLGLVLLILIVLVLIGRV
jgi:hypothetical protein